MSMEPSQPVSRAPAPSEPPAPITRPAEAGAHAVIVDRPRAASGGVLNVLLVLAAVLAAGGVAFAVGRSTAPVGAFSVGNVSGGPITRQDGSFDPVAGGPRVGLGAALSMGGTVTAIDDDSITLRLDDGSEQVIAIGDTTAYREATAATPGDVAVGDAVTVQVDGGRIQSGAGASSPPELTAREITVSR
jgi:hypothetical protein